MTATATQREVKRYVEGAVVHAVVEIAADCVGVDPTALTVTVRKPDKSVVTYTYGVDPEVKKVAMTTGQYYIDLATFGFPGRWVYYWRGTGNHAGADRWEFIVTQRPTEDDAEP